MLPRDLTLHPSDRHFSSRILHYTPLAQLFVALVLMVYFLMGVARRGGDLIAGWIHVLLALLGGMCPGEASIFQRVHQELPTTLDGILSSFNMDGDLIVHAVCPACHANYPPGKQGSVYPTSCSNMANPGEVCGAALLDEKGEPLKTVSFHSFSDYLGTLLSRSDLEDAVEAANDAIHHDSGEYHRSPFEAEFLRGFNGPDGKTLFVSGGEGNELRLVFSLCVDFFASAGMRVRGPTNSLGIIALVCLNLPIEVRYKPENMFLFAIVPGPQEPALTQLNHYIEPLVNTLLTSWHVGIRLSRTARHPGGRLVRSALALVVCDLPASRKTASLAPSIAKIFCQVCNCWDVRDTEGNIIPNWTELRGRTDHNKWCRRDVSAMRQAAEMWRDAPTAEERKNIFKKFGIRWSPLWLLPYWDPTRQLVVDSMHCLLEGLIKFHVVQALGLTDAATTINSRLPPAFEQKFLYPDEADILETAMVANEPGMEEGDKHVPPSERMEGVEERASFSEHIPSFGQEEANEHAILPEQRWTAAQLRDLRGIHRHLTLAVCADNDKSHLAVGYFSFSELENYLAKRCMRSLVYVAQDLGIGITTSRPKKAMKKDYAAAMVQWVACFLLMPCSALLMFYIAETTTFGSRSASYRACFIPNRHAEAARGYFHHNRAILGSFHQEELWVCSCWDAEGR